MSSIPETLAPIISYNNYLSSTSEQCTLNNWERENLPRKTDVRLHNLQQFMY